MTEVAPISMYYPAEPYHQQYLARGGRFGRPQNPTKGCNDPIRCAACAQGWVGKPGHGVSW